MFTIKFSWRSFLVTFLPALVIFSVIMAVVCHHAFAGKVPVRTDAQDVQEKSYVSDATVYYRMDGDALDYAVMVFTDTASGETRALAVEGEWLLTYKDALYFVKTLCQDYSNEYLCQLYEVLCGASIEGGLLVDVCAILPEAQKDVNLRHADFLDYLSSHSEDALEIKEISPVLIAQNEYKRLDVEATRDLFDVKG